MKHLNSNILKIFKDKKIYFLFTISFLFNFWFIYNLSDTYLKFPEFWAEEGLIYVDILKKNFSNIELYIDKHYPYFAVFPRLISFITALFSIPTQHIPFFYHLISIIFVCFCTSFFCLKRFSCIIKSDFFRFLLCILLSLNHDYDNKTILNAAYYGSIPSTLYIFYIFFSKIPISKLKSIYIGLLFFILILSKPIFILITPIIVFFYFFNKEDKQKISLFIVLVICVIGSFIQIYAYFSFEMFQLEKVETIKTNYITKILYNTFYDFISIPISNSFGIIYFKIIPLSYITILISFFFFCSFYCLLHFYFNVLNKNILILFLIFLFLSLGNSFMISYSGFQTPKDTQHLDHIGSRHFYLSSVFFIFLFYKTIIFIFEKINLSEKYFFRIIPYFLILIHSNSNYVHRIKSFNKLEFPIIGVSSWKDDYHLLQRKNYCIPLNPYPWMISNNCSYFYLNKIDLYNYIKSRKTSYTKNFLNFSFSIDEKKFKKLQSIYILASDKIGNNSPLLEILFNNGDKISVLPKDKKSFEGFFKYQFIEEISNIKNIKIINDVKLPYYKNSPIIIFYGW